MAHRVLCSKRLLILTPSGPPAAYHIVDWHYLNSIILVLHFEVAHSAYKEHGGLSELHVIIIDEMRPSVNPEVIALFGHVLHKNKLFIVNSVLT